VKSPAVNVYPLRNGTCRTGKQVIYHLKAGKAGNPGPARAVEIIEGVPSFHISGCGIAVLQNKHTSLGNSGENRLDNP